MNAFVFIKQKIFFWLTLATVFSFAATTARANPALVRNLAADFVEVLGLPEEEQLPAIRIFMSQHRDWLAQLATLDSPGQAIIGSRLLEYAPQWTPEMEGHLVRAVNFTLKHRTFQELLPLANELPEAILDRHLKVILRKSAQALAKVRMSEQPAFHHILDPKSGATIRHPEVRRMVEDVLPKFYDALPLRMKTRMVAAVLRLPPDATVSRQAAEVLQGSGPFAQKLFQLIGRESKSPEMTAVFQELLDNIKPVPQAEVEAIVKARLGQSVEEIFSEFSQPIRSGTIGQVNFGVLREDGTEVATKVLRPGVKADFLAEVQALREATKGTKSAKLVDKARASVERELNFLDEAKNIAAGQIYVNDRSGVGVVNLVDSFPPQENILVMRKLKGRSFDHFSAPAELLKRGEGMSQLYQSWLTHAILRDGFFHADPHPGNFLFDLTDDKIGYRLHLLDFGSANRLTYQEQKGFVKLFAALTLRAPEDALSAMEEIGYVPPASREMLLEEIRATLAHGPTGSLDSWYGEVFERIASASAHLDVEAPESFLAFSRGRDFFEAELQRINDQLDVADPAHKLKRFPSTRVLARTFLAELPKIPGNSFLAGESKVLTFERLQEMARMWKNSLYEGPVKMCRQLYGALRGKK